MAEEISCTSLTAHPVRVLYLHPFGVFGGATKSLAEMFSALPAGSVEGIALAPSGVAQQTLIRAGMTVLPVRGLSQWDNTRVGFYRGLRWIVLLRELALLWPTLRGLQRAKAHTSYDVVHCNEITGIPAAMLAARMLRLPIVMHVRSLQHADHQRFASRIIYGWLRRHVARLVVIDEAVRRTLPDDLEVEVVHNGMAAPGLLARAKHSSDKIFTVAIIGVLHRMKGVYELVEAVRVLRDRGVKIKLLVVGENGRTLSGLRLALYRMLDLANDVKSDLQAYVAAHDLGEQVEFTGFVSDISTVYERIDAVCFPSHLDAPGRPVFEAALYGLPAIVAMRNPTRDVIEHEKTGICIDRPHVTLIADAIQRLAEDDQWCRQLGENARQAAMQRFESTICAIRMLRIYNDVVKASQNGQ